MRADGFVHVKNSFVLVQKSSVCLEEINQRINNNLPLYI